MTALTSHSDLAHGGTRRHVRGHDGTDLHETAWAPAGIPAGTVVVVHGRSEHGGRYGALAGDLVAAGWAVRAPDQRGNGRSAGRRGRVERFDDLVEDLSAHVRRARAELPGLPVAVLGHSWGGLVALLHAARHPGAVDGLVVCAPAARPPDAGPLKRAVIGALGAFVPHAPVARIDLTRASRSVAVVEELLSDPLVHRSAMGARTAREALRAMDELAATIRRVEAPVLVLHGSGDRITDPAASRFVHAGVGSADRTLVVYDGLWHELLHEPERDRVVADIIGWLRDRFEEPADVRL